MNIGSKVKVISNVYENGCAKDSVCEVVAIRSGVIYVLSGNPEDTRNPYPFFVSEVEEIV